MSEATGEATAMRSFGWHEFLEVYSTEIEEDYHLYSLLIQLCHGMIEYYATGNAHKVYTLLDEGTMYSDGEPHPIYIISECKDVIPELVAKNLGKKELSKNTRADRCWLYHTLKEAPYKDIDKWIESLMHENPELKLSFASIYDYYYDDKAMHESNICPLCDSKEPMAMKWQDYLGELHDRYLDAHLDELIRISTQNPLNNI